MARQRLGTKKLKRIELLTGRKAVYGLTRGGNPHGTALVKFMDWDGWNDPRWGSPRINYATPGIWPYPTTDAFKYHEVTHG